MNLRWSLVKDRVKDGGGGASTNALRNPHLVRGLGFWQCGGCAPRDDERGRRPARRGLRHTRIRRHQRRLAYRPTAPAPRSRTHPASAGPARSAVARDGRSGHSRGVPPRGVPAPARIPGSAMHPRTPDPAISAGRLASGYTSSYDHGRRRRGYPCVNARLRRLGGKRYHPRGARRAGRRARYTARRPRENYGDGQVAAKQI